MWPAVREWLRSIRFYDFRVCSGAKCPEVYDAFSAIAFSYNLYIILKICDDIDIIMFIGLKSYKIYKLNLVSIIFDTFCRENNVASRTSISCIIRACSIKIAKTFCLLTCCKLLTFVFNLNLQQITSSWFNII